MSYIDEDETGFHADDDPIQGFIVHNRPDYCMSCLRDISTGSYAVTLPVRKEFGALCLDCASRIAVVSSQMLEDMERSRVIDDDLPF